MSRPTVGSLFAGIGGFDLGLERAGFEVKWQVEIDPFCRAVLAKHWPNVRRYDDVRTVGRHNLEAVDVVCGGFPCQDISLAGKGAGLVGERSGLWVEFARIIRELRPPNVIVENVAALLGRGLGDVLGDLAACGYDAEWDCLPASAFGAPHQRDRVWIVAYTSQLHSDGGGVHREYSTSQVPESGDCCGSPGMADPNCPRLSQSRHARAVVACSPGVYSGATINRGSWWRSEPNVGRVAYGIPTRVDRLRGLGNAVVPQIAEFIGRQLLQAISERVA